MSSDEEPDYMSDDFLAKCLPQDVKPGLKRTHADKRLHDVMKKKEEEKALAASKEPKKTKKELEEEKRQEGLQKSLDSSNKGFAMLQKMGYKAGESLGKANVGLVEPISIVVKSNRGGLGREAVLQQIEVAKTEFRRKKLEEWRRRKKESMPSAEEFRAQKSKERRLKQIETDLYQSQKSCRQLDMAKNFDEPAEKWFWPFQEYSSALEDEDEVDDKNECRQKDESDVNEDDSSQSDDESQGPSDDYLRASSTNVESAQIEEMSEDQPADAEEDQPVMVVEEQQQEFEPEEMLSILTGYLRSEHLYCLWCGITFSDVNDLNSNCPGPTRDDHDD